MIKSGATQAKYVTNCKLRLRAIQYLNNLGDSPIYRLVMYRTARGMDYGVVVNVGDKISVWNAFKEKIDQFTLVDFQSRLIVDAEPA